jgi:hypothetical protein
MQVLDGGGTLDPTSHVDHPYFGQIFLAAVFKIIGYPFSLNPHPGDIHSIETLYLVPRLLMGILAVVDTFLIYKIADWRYNRKVAFIASILFAVMPLTWFLRKIYLDSIQLPFLLSSILFAVYFSKEQLYTNRKEYSTNNNKNGQNKDKNDKYHRQIPIILLSGILLGLAIFTKLPGLTMIPLVGYLIFTNNGRSWKKLALWFAPVILIPLIWPLHTLLYGQFDRWVDGIIWESHRIPRPLLASITYPLQIDPVLIILGMSGMVFCLINRKRDFLPILWIVPFLVLFYTLNYFSPFHIIYLIPAFCIAAAVLILKILSTIEKMLKGEMNIELITRYFTKEPLLADNELQSQSQVKRKNKVYSKIISPQYLFFVTAAIIVIFGLTTTTRIISTDVTFSHFELYASIVKAVSNVYGTDKNYNNKVTIIGPEYMEGYYWIPKYIFNKDVNYLQLPIEDLPDSRFILIADKDVKDVISSEENSNDIKLLQKVYKMSQPLGEYDDQSVNSLNFTANRVDQRELSGDYNGLIQLRTNLLNRK